MSSTSAYPSQHRCFKTLDNSSTLITDDCMENPMYMATNLYLLDNPSVAPPKICFRSLLDHQSIGYWTTLLHSHKYVIGAITTIIVGIISAMITTTVAVIPKGNLHNPGTICAYSLPSNTCTQLLPNGSYTPAAVSTARTQILDSLPLNLTDVQSLSLMETQFRVPTLDPQNYPHPLVN